MESHSLLPSNNIKLEPACEADCVQSSAREIISEVQDFDNMDNRMSASIKMEQPEVYVDYPDEDMKIQPCSQSCPSLQEQSQMDKKREFDNLEWNHELPHVLCVDRSHRFSDMVDMTNCCSIQKMAGHSNTESKMSEDTSTPVHHREVSVIGTENVYIPSQQHENCSQMSESDSSMIETSTKTCLTNENCQIHNVETPVKHTQISGKSLDYAVGYTSCSPQIIKAEDTPFMSDVGDFTIYVVTKMGDNHDIVDELLTKTQFVRLPYENKLEIVKIGRPQPPLPELKSEHKEKSRVYTRCFNTTNYQKYPWLTGSTKINKLYCWACLLFSTDTGPWNKSGFNSLNYLASACDKHQRSLGHIRAFSALQTFGSQRIDHSLNLQKKIADSVHNEKVKENRMILRRLIDVVSFLGKQECAFRDHNGPQGLTNNGMYIELLDFLATYDSTIANHLKTATVFRGTSPIIQNDLIDAVAGVITDKIKSEISNATFVAILLDEKTDITNKSQLSTVMRFVDNEGNCQERFLHFSNVSSDRTAQGLFQHVIKVVDELDCSKKIVAQSYDGAAVLAGHVSGLQDLVKNKYPSATFIHCCSHRLNSVLSKSTNCITECRRFFTTLSGITNFFSHSTVRTAALKDFMEKNLLRVAPTRWNFSSRLINTVQQNREHLIKFFSTIENDTDDWTTDEVNTASGFVRFLCKFETIFLILVFNKIFTLSDVLFDILQKKCMDIFYCTNQVNEFYQTLQKIRDEDYDDIWTEATNHAQDEDEEYEYEPRPKRQRNVDRSKYHCIFNEILDTLMFQIQSRFESQKDLKFVSLLDCSNFDTFCKRFPQDLLEELKEPYASNFDIVRLKNELNVFYTLDEYKKKSVNEITIYMKLNNLDIVFSEVYKLAELILTFPSTTAAVESSFSALKRIQTYLRATQGQIRLNNLAILSIEKNILLDMKMWSEETFYENVTLKFTQKEGRMEFFFK